jgi:hypothetical protein
LKETGLSKARMEAALNNMSFDEYQAKEANKMRVAIRGYIEKRMKAARIKAAEEAIMLINQKRQQQHELHLSSSSMRDSVKKSVA